MNFKSELNLEKSFLLFAPHNLDIKNNNGMIINNIPYPKNKYLFLYNNKVKKRKRNKMLEKRKAILEALFLPIIIGKVFAFIFKSPLTSSISLIISLIRVVRKAKNTYPRIIL